jgi:hypothetical protein
MKGNPGFEYRQVPSASGFPETSFQLEDLLVGNPAETPLLGGVPPDVFRLKSLLRLLVLFVNYFSILNSSLRLKPGLIIQPAINTITEIIS